MMRLTRIAAVISMLLAMGLAGCAIAPPANLAEDQMKPLRSVQTPPTRVPQATANSIVLAAAQYSWGSGNDRRVLSPDPSAMPITDVPTDGDTIDIALAITVRPSLMSISAFRSLRGTAFDCEKPGACDVSEDGKSLTIRVTAPDAQMVTLRTAFDVPSETSDTGLGEPFTASWVVRLIR